MWPTKGKIAKALGLNERTVQRSDAKLVAVGLMYPGNIKNTTRYKGDKDPNVNVYHMVDVEAEEQQLLRWRIKKGTELLEQGRSPEMIDVELDKLFAEQQAFFEANSEGHVATTGRILTLLAGQTPRLYRTRTDNGARRRAAKAPLVKTFAERGSRDPKTDADAAIEAAGKRAGKPLTAKTITEALGTDEFEADLPVYTPTIYVVPDADIVDTEVVDEPDEAAAEESTVHIDFKGGTVVLTARQHVRWQAWFPQDQKDHYVAKLLADGLAVYSELVAV